MMPRGLMVKRHVKSPFEGSVGLLEVKSPLPLKKSFGKTLHSVVCNNVFHSNGHMSDHSESPEPEVLDLRIKRSPPSHHGFLYGSTLQSLLQSIPSSLRQSPPLSLPMKIDRNGHTSQEISHSRSISVPPKKRVNHGNSCITKSNKRKSAPLSQSCMKMTKTSVKKTKVSALKKLAFDEHKSSPVSGTFILDSDAEDDEVAANMGIIRRNGDIDPSLNVVIETEEARTELSKIDNKIGDYDCCLCRQKFVDAFRLASHRCPRIVHIEYRCTECEKVFNCPANLASHRRWHKPRDGMTKSVNNNVTTKATTTTTSSPMSDCEAEQSPPNVFICRSN